jgi:hypothetical protein
LAVSHKGAGGVDLTESSGDGPLVWISERQETECLRSSESDSDSVTVTLPVEIGPDSSELIMHTNFR